MPSLRYCHSAVVITVLRPRCGYATVTGNSSKPRNRKVSRRTGGPAALCVYQALKERRILVRLMRYPGHPDGLRITVGTDAEIDLLLENLGEVLTRQ